MMSKMVDPDEQGVLFAAIATLETVCTLLGALVFNSIYPLFLHIDMKGMVFVVMASFMCIAFILLEVVKRKDRKHKAAEVQETKD
ncbi:proton-coupled folate transporter-like [Exaiptasia diaphana]|uniref:Uncharacterized protein n=1 Tax=Exaiptasia diaphana TaxID=2652724 RepID=A0A913WX98_EXADI|nr:proton-coupled folate transporter-like [Exaiptasia diaphana]XP_028513474.1 proton-coupled folate transporter-like [Exaiptasia diaphana]